MALSEPQKKYLRSLGHHLKPVLMIAESGVSESVLKEYESSIAHHELIKVSIRVGDRDARAGVIDTLCAGNSAVVVQRIGNIALMYRENREKKKRIRLPQ